MSDYKLRELERRWRETQSNEDEAVYLRERVRVGDLTQERLELAAYCGHEGAQSAMDACQLSPLANAPSSSDRASSWAAGLERFGEPPLYRVILLAVRRLAELESSERDSLDRVLSLGEQSIDGRKAREEFADRACELVEADSLTEAAARLTSSLEDYLGATTTRDLLREHLLAWALGLNTKAVT